MAYGSCFNAFRGVVLVKTTWDGSFMLWMCISQISINMLS